MTFYKLKALVHETTVNFIFIIIIIIIIINDNTINTIITCAKFNIVLSRHAVNIKQQTIIKKYKKINKQILQK